MPSMTLGSRRCPSERGPSCGSGRCVKRTSKPLPPVPPLVLVLLPLLFLGICFSLGRRGRAGREKAAVVHCGRGRSLSHLGAIDHVSHAACIADALLPPRHFRKIFRLSGCCTMRISKEEALGALRMPGGPRRWPMLRPLTWSAARRCGASRPGTCDVVASVCVFCHGP